MTDARLLELSKDFFSEELLEELGIKGLGIPDNTIQKHIKNHPNDITRAALAILREWRNSQENATIAYENICKALKHIEMPYLIKTTLR